MGSLVGLFTGNGALSGIFSGVSEIIGKFVTDPQQKLQATVELAKMQNDTTLKLADLDTQWAKTQGDVVMSEAKSESWITRNWRPLTMLTFVFFIGYILFTGGFVNGHQIDKDFVLEILSIVKVGLGGYVFGRSVEKFGPDVASNVAQIFAPKKDSK